MDAVEREHFADLERWLRDPACARSLALTPYLPPNPQLLEDWVEKQAQAPASRWLIVTRPGDRKPLGIAGYRRIDAKNRKARAFAYLEDAAALAGPEGRECFAILDRFAREENDWVRIGVDEPDGSPALAAALAAGYQVEVRLREGDLVSGRRVDRIEAATLAFEPAPQPLNPEPVTVCPRPPAGLEGTLVRLDPPRLEHAETFKRWLSDGRVNRFIRPWGRYPMSLKDEHGWIDRYHQDQSGIGLVIADRATGRIIGTTGFGPNSPGAGDAVLGIGIGEPEYWGRGYGSEAFDLLTGFAFRERDLHRVTLDVYEGNPRAERSYLKLGFRREGVRPGDVYLTGSRITTIVMGLLRSEWEARATT
jgi:RimJ/RimL family protein N-acetyltransferase